MSYCHKSYLQKDQSQAPQWMLDTHKVIQESQGSVIISESPDFLLGNLLDTSYSAISGRFVIVTAEYNCSLPPALTNLLDYFPPASFRHVNGMSTHCQHIVNTL